VFLNDIIPYFERFFSESSGYFCHIRVQNIRVQISAENEKTGGGSMGTQGMDDYPSVGCFDTVCYLHHLVQSIAYGDQSDPLSTLQADTQI
jgi:hypothetical protein